jgi:two-component system chemotaxis sensor kinase CheA
VGLVVDEILDIVEELIEKRDIGCRAGVLGSAVIQGRVTELLDIQAVLAKAIITLAA